MEKFGYGIRDGTNSDPESGINIPWIRNTDRQKMSGVGKKGNHKTKFN
jgi:hypothetical protein